MNKAVQTANASATRSQFAGKSAKDVREIGLSDASKRAEALAYAVKKQAELAGHKFRGQLWAQTVAALSGVPVASAKKPKASAKKAEPSKAEILAQLQALIAAL